MTEYLPVVIFAIVAVILVVVARIVWRHDRPGGRRSNPGGRLLSLRFGVMLLLVCASYAGVIIFHKHDRRERTIAAFQSVALCDVRQIAENLEREIQIIQAQIRVIATNPTIMHSDTRMEKWPRLFQSCYGLMDHRWVRTLSRTSADAHILITTPDESKIGLDVSHQPHNRRMMSERKALVSDPFIAVQGFKAIAITEPVFNRDAFDGWVTALIDFESLLKRFNQLSSAGGIARMGLMDRNGTILADINPGITSRTIATMVSLDPGNSKTVERILHDEEGMMRYLSRIPSDGRPGPLSERVGAFARIHLGGDNFWVAGVTADESEMLDHFPNSFWPEVAFCLIFLGLIVLAAADRLRHEHHYAEVLEREVDSGRKQAEEARHLLATVIEQSTEAIFLTDVRGIIQYVNPAFCTLTGTRSAAILNRHALRALSGLRNRELCHGILECLMRGGIWRGHLTHRRGDGTLCELESLISPVRDDAERIVSFVSVNRDATLERALEAQLRQSQKMEAIGKLAGGVAHDFNNVLTAIVGNIQLAQRQGAESVQRFLKVALVASERATEMVRQLLTFSRKGSDVRQSVNLNELILETVRLVEKSIDRRIRFATDLEGALPLVMADPNQLHQVIMNLCVNARDAIVARLKAEERGPAAGREYFITLRSRVSTVTDDYCRLHSFAHPGRFVVLAVKDDGVGIDRETLARIFEPFFTTKAVGEGTGLGLSTVYGIVKSHNGWVDVESEPGMGAEFIVYIPASPADGEVSIFSEAELIESVVEY